MPKPYTPAKKILEKYADLLVNFALRGEKGIRKGDVVLLQVEEPAKPMLVPLQAAVLRAGGHPMTQFIPSGTARQYYELATDEQLTWFPAKFLRGRVDEVDHYISILADDDPRELEGVDPKRIMRHSLAMKRYKEWRDEKENKGYSTWTLALYGTEASAKEAKMSLKAYWRQIIKACYLDKKDPVKEWRRISKEIHRVRDKLNRLRIEKVHVVAKDTDLWVRLGPNRKWLGGRGCNIPSYEVFISPDCRGTEGHISFDQPLYRYGTLIKDVKLWFHAGKVVKATASKNQKVLREMIATPGADMVGEFSLTDKRISRIDTFMAETLYDENRGGKYGNTHVALGNAYQDSFTGNRAKVTKAQWKRMGYNDSVVHTDIVQTRNRTVTAHLPGGKELVIYKDGKFTI